MRNLIDIPKNIYKNLQHICIDEETNPKNWIENLVVNEVKKKSKQLGQT